MASAHASPTPLEHIIAKTGARPSREGYLGHCPCPAHSNGDKHPSLSITERDGRIMLYCFTSGRSGDQLVEHFDLTTSDLFTRPGGYHAPRGAQVTLDKLAAHKQLPIDFLSAWGLKNAGDGVTIPYHDLAGKEVYRRRRVKMGGKRHTLQPEGQPLMVYGLEMLNYARQVETLLIVEGESDTLTAFYQRIPALGVPGANAVKTVKRDYLKGIGTVYVLQEHDAAGATFASQMPDHLTAIGYDGEVKVITMPEGCKDLNDLHRRDVEHFQAAFKQCMDAATGVAEDERTICLADVEEMLVDWLWYGRLAFGKIAIIDGDPDMGKSLIYGADIAARITTGRCMPHDIARHFTGNVLIISMEDGTADTIKPRIRQAGGDVSKVYVWDELSLPSEIHRLERMIKRHKIRYLMIDPILGALDGNIKSGVDNEVRRALQPLKRMVERTHVACVMLRHFKKGEEKKAIHQGGGSVAFTGVARIGQIVSQDHDSGCNVLATAKCNLIARDKRPSLNYTIASDGEDLPPYIKWLGESTLKADDLLHQEDSEERRDILQVLRTAMQPLTPKEIADQLGEKVNNVNQLLLRLVRQGHVMKIGYGKYTVKVEGNSDHHQNNSDRPHSQNTDQSDQTDQSSHYNSSHSNGNYDQSERDRSEFREKSDHSDRSDRSDRPFMNHDFFADVAEQCANAAPDVHDSPHQAPTLAPLYRFAGDALPMASTTCAQCGVWAWTLSALPGYLVCTRCHPRSTWHTLAEEVKRGS